MPLIKGKSKAAFSHNVGAEMNAGKPQNQALAIAYSMKKRAKKMAQGGMVDEQNSDQNLATAYQHPEKPKEKSGGLPGMSLLEGSGDEGMAHGGEVEDDEEESLDMVGRVMHKHKYSEGGMVANNVGVAEADENPAEYDDLVLRDDLAFDYDGANSGDELGNAGEDERRADIIERIMRSRAKKDRMPRPA